jgi:hypothetical protein
MEWESLSLGEAGVGLNTHINWTVAMETANPAKTLRTKVGVAFGIYRVRSLPEGLGSWVGGGKNCFESTFFILIDE